MLPLGLAQPLAARVSNIIAFLIIPTLPKSSVLKLCQRHADNCLTPYFPILLLVDLNN